MNNPIDSTTPETLTDEDLAQVNGGITIKEFFTLRPPLPYLPDTISPIGVNLRTPGPEYHLPEGANDPRNAIFFDE